MSTEIANEISKETRDALDVWIMRVRNIPRGDGSTKRDLSYVKDYRNKTEWLVLGSVGMDGGDVHVNASVLTEELATNIIAQCEQIDASKDEWNEGEWRFLQLFETYLDGFNYWNSFWG